MKIELNQNEAAVLLNLIDLAVKAVGMQAAEAAVHLSKIIATVAKADADAQAVDSPVLLAEAA